MPAPKPYPSSSHRLNKKRSRDKRQATSARIKLKLKKKAHVKEGCLEKKIIFSHLHSTRKKLSFLRGGDTHQDPNKKTNDI
jgi:hypothetical protein